jgi:hypothetical protein
MQLALVYDAAHAGADDWREILSWFWRAVEVVNHKEVAFRLDIAPSQLTDAMHERDRKDVKAKWIYTVLRMCPESLVREYVEIVGRLHGYEVKKQRVRTPEEELREMRELLKREAPGVLAIVEKEMGR